MRRAKMERPFTDIAIFLLVVAASTITTTNGANTNATTILNVSKYGTSPSMMGGAAPRTAISHPPPPSVPKMGVDSPKTSISHPPSPSVPKMGGASPKTAISHPPPPSVPTTGGAAHGIDGTSSSAPPAPSAPLYPQEQEFLNAHNVVRYHAGLPPLKWDSKVAAYARWYAKSRMKDCALQHSTGPFGENIFWGEGRTWTPQLAVRDWVKEHRFYDRRFHSCQPGQMCGHYTQIVWRDTTKLGCAEVLCGPGDTYIVCSYDPPGNYRGKKPFERHNPVMYNQQDRLTKISWIPNH